MQHGRKHFSTLRGSLPLSLSTLFSIPTFHTSSGLFSITQVLNLVSTWVKVPHLGTFIWFQYLNFRLCASHQTSYIFCTHWVLISILPPSLSATSCVHLPPRCPSTTSCIHVVSYVAPPWPPRNFLQTSCFNILSCHAPVPLSSFLHSCGFNM